MRVATLAVTALTLALAIAFGVLLLVAHPRYSIETLAGDDAGYYFAIARNVCLGHGFSFDRLSPTNGFNPLQTLLLIVAFRLFAPGLSVLACYRVGVGLSWLTFVAAAIPYARLVDAFVDDPVGQVGRGGEPPFGASAASRSQGWRASRGGREAAPDGRPTGPKGGSPPRPTWTRRLVVAAALAFFACFVSFKNYYGMDGPLVLLIGSAYLLRVMRRGFLAPGLRAGLVDGGLLAALFLARVDMLPFLAAAFALMAWTALAEPGRRSGLRTRIAATAALVAPYFAWSLATFGLWLPVSARIKSSFPDASLGRSLEVVRHTSLNLADQASFLLAFLLAAAIVVRHLRSPARGAPPTAGRPAVLMLLALYLLGRIGYMLLFSRADVQGGYVILAHVFNVLVAVRVVSALAARAADRGGERAAARVIATACALLVALSLGLMALKARNVVARWRAIEPGGAGDETALAGAIHRVTGPRDVLYGGAFGMLGFLADRPWINGDGVANDLAYQRALAAHALERYLAERGVTHVVFVTYPGDAAPGPRRVAAHGFLSGRTADVAVDERDAVLRWRSLRGGGADVVVARWTPAAAR